MRLATLISATIRFSRSVTRLPDRTVHTVTTHLTTKTQDVNTSHPRGSHHPPSFYSGISQESSSHQVSAFSLPRLSFNQDKGNWHPTQPDSMLEPLQMLDDCNFHMLDHTQNQLSICYRMGMLEPAIFHRKLFSKEALKYYFLGTGALPHHHHASSPSRVRPLSPFNPKWRGLFFQQGDHLKDIALGLTRPHGILRGLTSELMDRTLAEFSESHDAKHYQQFHEDLGYFLGYPGFVNPNGVVYKTADLQHSFVISAMLKAVLDQRKIKFSLEGINPEHIEEKPSYHPEYHGGMPINVLDHLRSNYDDIPRTTFTLFELANVLSFLPFYMHCEFFLGNSSASPLTLKEAIQHGLFLRHPHLYQEPSMMLRHVLGYRDSNELMMEYRKKYNEAMRALSEQPRLSLYSFIPQTRTHLSDAEHKFIPLPVHFITPRMPR